MSSIPPEPPGSAPPPPPPPPPIGPDVSAAPGLPWENRAQLGLGPAFVETVKLIATQPAQAFAMMREKGDLFEALLFGLIPGWVGAVFASLWSLAFPPFWMTMMPGSFRDQLGAAAAASVASVVMQIVLAPVLITIVLFVGAGIQHLCLMIVGALSGSRAGFEGTFRTVCYAGVADFAQLVPFVGWLIAMVWKIVLLVIGFAAVHRTSRGKALLAILIPIIVCCGCLFLLGATIAALIGGMMANR